MNKVEKIKQTKGFLGKSLVVMAALGSITMASATTTVDDGSFEDLRAVLTSWLQGSLGKILALLGFVGTFLVYLMTHKGSVLFVGILISLIAGGLVGISEVFFNIGTSTFDAPAVP